jgi:type II secretory pathway pseudopilin PulG
MKQPAIRKSRSTHRKGERGVTMIIVAVAMIAIMAMAALSIDVITLYLAREEAQRSADSAALAAAKIISLSGLTADPTNGAGNWGKICGPDDGTNGLATRTAKAVAGQDTIGNGAATTINVTYSSSTSPGAGSGDCTTLSGAGSAFGINPLVTVQLTRASLPSFFSRIWGNTGGQVTASATAETYNPSNSASVGSSGVTTPVQPRCVKPWAVPNLDPRNPDNCTKTGDCHPFVNLPDGSIYHQGMSLGGVGTGGTVGENLWLVTDCRHISPGSCNPRVTTTPPPMANWPASGRTQPPPNLIYVPAQVGNGSNPLAVPSCSTGTAYGNAITGCDQAANYSCGVPPAGNPNPNTIDMSIYANTDTTDGVKCLTRQSDATDITTSSGQDRLAGGTFGKPDVYPYRMLAGSNNPIGITDAAISNSASVVSLPIYDETTAPKFNNGVASNVTFVGFLQVFINAVDDNGNVNVTVLNVTGCSNNATGTQQIGNSPVPVRLITPP